jgi:uncharacterized short protein YbdD (DUF466 family)
MIDRHSNIRKNAAGHGAKTNAVRAWLARAVRHLWQGVREWCGDSAYERYLYAQRLLPEERAALTREQFYVEQLNRRYSRPNRCC